MNLASIIKDVCKLTESAGSFVLRSRADFESVQIEEKSFNNLVTDVDKTVERVLIEGLNKILPNAGFIAEEGTETIKGDRYNWIIDPIDGTTNFVHNIPCFCISIALQEHEEIIGGVILEINQNECFYAHKGGGAFLNGRPIQVSSTKNLQSSLVATGFPYDDFGQLDNYFNLLKALTQKTRGVRRMGSAAADLAYVACGRFDCFYEYALSPWDVAAGMIIVKEAGGQVSDFKGGDDCLYGKEIIASNSETHAEFLAILKDNF